MDCYLFRSSQHGRVFYKASSFFLKSATMHTYQSQPLSCRTFLDARSCNNRSFSRGSGVITILHQSQCHPTILWHKKKGALFRLLAVILVERFYFTALAGTSEACADLAAAV